MKKVTLALLLCAAVAATAQNHLHVPDSAKIVLDRYTALLNYDQISNDSMLYIESLITMPYRQADTLRMRRWFAMPNYYRIEVWRGTDLLAGYLSDGGQHFRQYDTLQLRWKDIDASRYYDITAGYRFQGPLHHWNSAGIEVSYAGRWTLNGNAVYRLMVKDPQRYDRYYLFQADNGLLFYVDELDTHSKDMNPGDGRHVKWRAYHEYTPVGKQLFITSESYMMDNIVTHLQHTYRYMVRDMEPFYVDLYTPSKP